VLPTFLVFFGGTTSATGTPTRRCNQHPSTPPSVIRNRLQTSKTLPTSLGNQPLLFMDSDSGGARKKSTQTKRPCMIVRSDGGCSAEIRAWPIGPFFGLGWPRVSIRSDECSTTAQHQAVLTFHLLHRGELPWPRANGGIWREPTRPATGVRPAGFVCV